MSKTRDQKDQETHLIRGVVRDEMNDPLSGVSVLQNGTVNGVITNGEGEYESYSEENGTSKSYSPVFRYEMNGQMATTQGRGSDSPGYAIGEKLIS